MRNQSSKLQKINSKPQFKRIKRKIRAKINRTGRPHVKKNDYNKARRNHAKAYFRALQAYYNSFSISILMTYKKLKPNHQKNPQYKKNLSDKIHFFVGEKLTFIQMLSALMRHRFPTLDECQNASFQKNFLNQPCTRTLRSALVQLRKQKGLDVKQTLRLSINKLKSLYLACVLVRGIGVVQIDEILQNMLTTDDYQYFQSSWNSILGQLLGKTKLLTMEVFDRIEFYWDKIVSMIRDDGQQFQTINQANEQQQIDSYSQKEEIKAEKINEQQQKVQKKQKGENNNRVDWDQQNQFQFLIEAQHQQIYQSRQDDISYVCYLNLQSTITQQKVQPIRAEVNRISNTHRVQEQNQIISEPVYQQINDYQRQLQQRLRAEKQRNEKAQMKKKAEIMFNYGKVKTRDRNPSRRRYIVQQYQIQQYQIDQELTYNSIQQIALQEGQIHHFEQYRQNPNRKVSHQIRQIDTLVRFILQNELVIADAIANHIYSACKSQNVQIMF